MFASIICTSEMNIFLLLLLFYLSLMCPVWSFCSCDHLVWFNTRNNPAFPLCEEDLGFGSKLWQLSLWSNICCLLQHGGLRGAEGNMWNHLPEIPPVCVQLYVLGESPVRRVWVLLQRLLSSDVLSAGFFKTLMTRRPSLLRPEAGD